MARSETHVVHYEKNRDVSFKRNNSGNDGEYGMNNWAALQGVYFAYVVPLDDLKDHDGENEKCWCNPWWDEDILVHDAMDMRQEYERGRKMS